MEIMVKYGFYAVICILAVILILLVQKGKKEILLKTAMIAVEKVAEHFLSLDNSEKLAKAVEVTYGMLPKWFRWLVREKYLIWIVEEAYQMMKKYINGKLKNNERVATDLALITVGKTIGEAMDLSYNDDKNLCSNEQLKILNLKAEDKINQVWGNLKYSTDFKDDKQLLAEMGFKKSF